MRTLKRIFVLALAVADIAVAAFSLPYLWRFGLLEWVRGAGVTGVLIYALVYCLTTALMVPPSLLNAGAGLMFGPLWGTLLVYPPLMAAAMASFCLSRSLARDWLRQRIAQRPQFIAMDRAIARGGFKIVLLLRMSPISPFCFLSYSLGLTRVRLRDYFLGSLLGALPGAAVYVYLGAALNDLRDLPSQAALTGGLHRLLFWVGLAATVAAFAMITRYARQEINRTLAAPADG